MEIKETQRSLTVSCSYDVVVAGGGIAGISAALSARRMGARVLLIEREFLLGGLATLGLVTIYLPICDGEGRHVVRGIAEELLHLSISEGAERPLPPAWQKYFAGGRVSTAERRERRAECRYNATLFAILAERKLKSEGVDILYGTLVADTVVKRQKITHLILENKSGRFAVGTKSVIDATGDSDVAFRAGAPCVPFSQGNVLAAWYYHGSETEANDLFILGFSDVPNEEKTASDMVKDTRTRYMGLSGEELSRMTEDAHEMLLSSFLEKGKLSGSHTLNAVAGIPQVRMTRRISAPTVLTTQDEHREFADSVGLFTNWKKRGPVYELPFSALYSNKIKNLLAAGRNISANDAMWDVTRVIPVCAVSGEAAGIAAAISDNFPRLSVRKIQTELRRRGVYLHERQLRKF